MRVVYLMTANQYLGAIAVFAFLGLSFLFPSLSDAIVIGVLAFFANIGITAIYEKFTTGKLRSCKTELKGLAGLVTVALSITLLLNWVLSSAKGCLEHIVLVLIVGMFPVAVILYTDLSPYLEDSPDQRIRPQAKKYNTPPPTQVVSTPAQSAFCAQCGTPASDRAKFCVQCGTSLSC